MALVAVLETNFYANINKPTKNTKINKSNLISGILKNILPKLIRFNLNEKDITDLYLYDAILINNKENRHFKRKSDTPFTKWYLKSPSAIAEILKIINAIENNTTNELNKNLKTKSMNMKILDKKDIKFEEYHIIKVN